MTLNILLVDDLENVRETNKLLLMMLGHSTVEAENGRDAYRIFSENPSSFDLIITDVLMPEEDGIVFIQNLRNLAMEGVVIPPIIACSGGGSQVKKETVESLSNAFSSYFLPKPFSKDELATAIKIAIEAGPPNFLAME